MIEIMNLREYLYHTGLTYRQAAQLFRCSTTALYTWVSGKASPKERSKKIITRVTRGVVTFDNDTDKGKTNSLQTPKSKL